MDTQDTIDMMRGLPDDAVIEATSPMFMAAHADGIKTIGDGKDLFNVAVRFDEMAAALTTLADEANWRFGDNGMWHWKGTMNPCDIVTEALAKGE